MVVYDGLSFRNFFEPLASTMAVIITPRRRMAAKRKPNHRGNEIPTFIIATGDEKLLNIPSETNSVWKGSLYCCVDP